jgi:hypothetical protein
VVLALVVVAFVVAALGQVSFGPILALLALNAYIVAVFNDRVELGMGLLIVCFLGVTLPRRPKPHLPRFRPRPAGRRR